LSSAMDVVAGRLAFPAPSSTLGRCRPGPRGLPGPVAPGWRRVPRMRLGRASRYQPSWPFTSPSERSPSLPELLAASEKASSSSSLGIRPLSAPLPYDLQRVHSREPRFPSARRCHPSGSFRPRGFSPPRRFSPRRGCGFVAPRCRPWGSARFLLPAPGSARRLPGVPSHSPRRVSYPSKSSPHQQPYRITAAVALLPLLPAILARTCPAFAERLVPGSRSYPFRASAGRAGALPAFDARSSRSRHPRRASTPTEAVAVALCPRWPKPPPTLNTFAGRSPRRCSFPSRAEAFDGGPSALRRDWRPGPDCPATGVAGRAPKGPVCLYQRMPVVAAYFHRSGVALRKAGALPW
jgi:hypothetical protein